jgi:DNA-binding transcriptional ArsR family regulator
VLDIKINYTLCFCIFYAKGNNYIMAKKVIKSVSSKDQFAVVNKFLRTVADKNRLRILQVLDGKSMTVGEIYHKLKLPQNLTSHHISRLKSLELLSEKREGTFRIYSVNPKKLKEFSKAFQALLKF